MFVDDIPVEDAYFAFIVRSPVAKGRLKSVSCPSLGPQFSLLTAADIPGAKIILKGRLPLLAEERVSYIGEPLALITGPDLLKLEEYARQCIIDIDEEPPEFSVEDAWDAEDIFERFELSSPYQAKSKPELVVEGHYETEIQEHWYSEPHGAIALIDKDGGLTIKTAAQLPEDVRVNAALVLGIDVDKVHVENAGLGIHLDGKLWYPQVISSLAALAAFNIKKNTKLQLTREEDYLYSPKRTSSVIHIRSALTFEGQILETEVLAKIGFGAAAVMAEAALKETARGFLNIYRLGKLSIEALAIRTNDPPAGPFAGFGGSLASFALERHISKIADVLNEEGALWRKSHLKSKLKERLTGDNDIIAAVSKESGFKRKWAAYELLRSVPDREKERVLPQRGIGTAFAIVENEAEAGGAAELFQRSSAPAAAAVVEIEIDRINFESRIRGIWLHLTISKKQDAAKADLIVRRALNAAIGWTASEKIKFVLGKISPKLCAHYQIIPPSAIPEVHISFKEDGATSPADWSKFEKLTFNVVPPAYTHAISQAINHHLERIPIIGQDIWRVINMKRQESFEKDEEEPPPTTEI